MAYEPLKPLIAQARREGKWLHCKYQDLWFSPDELEADNQDGRFCWGPVNWTLRDPQERLQRAESLYDRIQRFRLQLEQDKSERRGLIVSDEQAPAIPLRPMRATSIKGLIPSLPERGKIKIGAKGAKRPTRSGQGEWQPPVKLDHFVVTTLARNPNDDNLVRDEEMHEQLGDTPTEIPIRLLYDDPELNFPTRYAAYNGRSLWCSGDGEIAQRMGQDGKRFELQCPCHLADPAYSPKSRNDPPRCKMNGSLSVIIDGASGLGGVWKFRTTSYNSINGIMSSMMFLRSITGGVLANIPLTLRVQPKQAVNPADGSSVLIYIVTLEFSGDMETLQKIGHKIALDRATTHVSIANIEHEARRMLALSAPTNAPLPGDESDDVVAEFYPEEYDKEPEGWTDTPRPTRKQFKTALPQREPDGYLVNLADGSVAGEFNVEDAFGMLERDMRERASTTGQKGLDAFWEDNKELMAQLHADGHAEVLGLLTEEFNTLSAKLAKPEVRSATVAQGDGQTRGQMEEGTLSPGKISPGASSPPDDEWRTLESSGMVPQDRPQAVTATNSPRPRAVVAGNSQPNSPPSGGATPPESQKDVMPGGKPRFLCEPITHGPGLGVDYRRTTDALVDMIGTLTKEEYSEFRKVNMRILASLNLSWREGAKLVNDKLLEKDAEFRG